MEKKKKREKIGDETCSPRSLSSTELSISWEKHVWGLSIVQPKGWRETFDRPKTCLWSWAEDEWWAGGSESIGARLRPLSHFSEQVFDESSSQAKICAGHPEDFWMKSWTEHRMLHEWNITLNSFAGLSYPTPTLSDLISCLLPLTHHALVIPTIWHFLEGANSFPFCSFTCASASKILLPLTPFFVSALFSCFRSQCKVGLLQAVLPVIIHLLIFFLALS